MAENNNAGDPKKQKQINSLLNTASGMMKNFGVEGEQAQKVIEQILQGNIKNAGILAQELKTLQKINQEYKKKSKYADNLQGLSERMNKLMDKESDLSENILDFTRDKNKIFKQDIQALRKNVMASKQMGNINMQQKQVMMDQLNTLQKFGDYTQKWGEVAKTALEDMNAGVDKAQGFLDNFMGKIPGGKYLSKMLGLDQASGILKKGLNKGMSTFVSQMAQGATKGQALNAALKAARLAIGPQGLIVLGIAAAVLAMAALAAATYAVYKALQKVTEEAVAFSKTTGMSVAQSKELVMQSYELHSSSENLLASAKEILEVQKELIDLYGRADMVTGKTAAKVADIGKAFGYGVEVSAQIQDTLMNVGGASEETAANMQIVANKMSQAMGVAPGKVMKDLAKNGNLLAKSMAGNAKEMIKVAAYAASIGLDIEKMLKATDGLLSIEDSLTSQMEYQAISGKKINMEKARYLKAIGDEKGAMMEMTKELEKQGDLSKMSPIAREKLAKLYGMEVPELMRINTLNQKTKEMTKEQADLVKKYGDSLGDISDKNADQLLQLASQAQMTERIKNMWSKLKSMLMSALAPLMDMVSIVLEDMQPAFKMMGATLDLFIFTPLKMIGKFIKMLYTSIVQPLVKAFDPLREAFTEMFERSAKRGESTFSKITDIIGKVLKPAFVAIGFAIKVILTPIAWLVKMLTFIGDIVGAIFNVFLSIGSVLVDVIMFPMNTIYTVLSNVYDVVWGGIAGAFNYVGDLIASVGQSISDFFMAPINMVKNAIRNMLPGWALKLLGMGGDETDAAQAEAQGLPSGGSIDDGVIQGGKIISTNPADTIVASKEPSSLLGGMPDMMKSALANSPMGMMAQGASSLLGGLFGGGGEEADPNTARLAQAIEDLNNILKSPIKATVSATQAAEAVNAENTYRS